jgi:hypothetical protein
MFRCTLILAIILSFGISGCSSIDRQKSNAQDAASLTPKFEVAADKLNDPVNGVTPEIQEAVIQSYLAFPEPGNAREDVKRVVNSIQVQGGTDYLVRTKYGFFIAFMDNQSQRVTYVSGGKNGDVSHTPMGGLVSPIKTDSKEMVYNGFFNIANAKKATLMWSNGTTSTYELINGTVMVSPFERNISVKKFEIKDESGKVLFTGGAPSE